MTSRILTTKVESPCSNGSAASHVKHHKHQLKSWVHKGTHWHISFTRVNVSVNSSSMRDREKIQFRLNLPCGKQACISSIQQNLASKMKAWEHLSSQRSIYPSKKWKENTHFKFDKTFQPTGVC